MGLLDRLRRRNLTPLDPSFGALIGEAFQVADDLRDALLDETTLGKPVGQDALHGRPNAVTLLGVDGATARLRDTLGNQIVSELLVKNIARRGYVLAIDEDVIRMI